MGESRVDLRDSWNRNTPFYHEAFNWSYDDVIYSSSGQTEDELHLLGALNGSRILEVGCGGGQASIALARRGASTVGIDLADEQVARARAKAAHFGVTSQFYQGDAEDLSRFESSSFEAVLSTHVYDYVENLPEAFAEVRRVLRPRGRFVFSVTHPMYRFVRPFLPSPDSAPLHRAHAVEQYSYHETGRFAFNWDWRDGVSIPMYVFRRRVSDFANAVIGAGFELTRVLEPEPVFIERAWRRFHPDEHLRLVPDALVFIAARPESPR